MSENKSDPKVLSSGLYTAEAAESRKRAEDDVSVEDPDATTAAKVIDDNTREN